MRNWLQASTAITIVLGAQSAALADFTFTPPPGVTDYRLMFVTADTISATSTDIATYNAFATAEAALSLTLPATTWSAVASTPSVAAVDNVSCGAVCDANVPIYLVDGTLYAASATSLFAGAILSVIGDQYGNGIGNYYDYADWYVWTGSNPDGTPDTGYELGQAYSPEYYGPDFMGYSWGNDGTTDSFPIFAISGDIGVPEPMSAALLGVGALAAGLARRGRRKHLLAA